MLTTDIDKLYEYLYSTFPLFDWDIKFHNVDNSELFYTTITCKYNLDKLKILKKSMTLFGNNLQNFIFSANMIVDDITVNIRDYKINKIGAK